MGKKMKLRTIEKAAFVAFIVLIILAGFMVVVGIIDTISRNETEWTDGGGRHVEMVSEKLSKED